MLWLRALRQDHLDLSMNSSADIRTRVVDRPGSWMSADELAALVRDVRTVARATLPDGDLSYGVLGGDAERLKASVITILYDRASGAPVAFNALAWLPVSLRGRATDVLHLGLVMVDPAARNRGMSWLLYGFTCFILFLRGSARPIWVSNVTQVPAVFGMVTESFAHVYPTPEPSRPSFEHVLLARQIMASHRHAFGVGADAGFDEARFVITDAYTGGSDDLKKSFDEAPKHRKEKFNSAAARELNYARGDDFLQLGQVNMSAAQAYVWDVVPRESLPGVLLSGAFLMVQSLVLPILHWFDAKTPWGSLRVARAAT
ncbi:hypothetical protein U91I_00230 [alpha proteobacterium U9-1i]|nr:hypothetical protein U91I_00230 [alpha proteobacterium U9-1i]